LFGKGNLHTRLHVGNIFGIRDVELAFNAMASQIQTLLDDVKLLSGGVSHDLKTSLARLRFGIDTIQEDPSAVSDTHLLRLSEDTDEMINMVHLMLQYTQLDMSLSSLKKNKVAFDEMLHDIVGKISTRQETKQVRLCLAKGSDTCMLSGHSLYLKMMVNNLISNATNYAQSYVDINLSFSNGKLCLSIRDDGPGIPTRYHKNVFKPFFRVPEQTVKGKEKHYGLGLAISQRIAEIHGGHIVLKSKTLADNPLNSQLLNTNILEKSDKNSQQHDNILKHQTGTEILVYFPISH
jgi:signal transduction histidine kinase